MIIKPYKDGYVLGQVDELTIILDESLANVNNTLANRYIKPIKPRAEKLSQDIQLIMEIVEKWVEAQRKWMYLENIFVAPDIKTQMPMESKEFEVCDKFIRGHVKRLLGSPKIMKLAKIQNLVEKFNEIV
jgi:dynein heavy chain